MLGKLAGATEDVKPRGSVHVEFTVVDTPGNKYRDLSPFSTVPSFFRRLHPALVATLAGVALLAPRVLAQTAPGVTPAPADSKLVAYLKLAPPKDLTDDVMGIVRQVAPGPQTDFMAMMMLSRVGYPNYAGVSPTAPMVVFLFAGPHPEDVGQVIAIQVAPDSPIVGTLSDTFRWYWVNPPQSPWVFFSTKAAFLTAVQLLSPDLIKTAGQPATKDLELVALLDNIFQWRSQIDSNLNKQIASANDPAAAAKTAQLLKWVNFAFDQAQDLQDCRIGLDLKTGVALSLAATARPGTALSEYLSAPLPASVPAATFLPADADMLTLVRTNPSATRAYFDHLLVGAQAIAASSGRTWLGRLQTTLDADLALVDGTRAGAITLGPGHQPQAKVVVGGQFTDADLVRCLNDGKDLLSTLPPLIPSSNSSSFPGVTINLHVAQENGVPISQVVTHVGTNLLPTANGGSSPSAAYAALLTNGFASAKIVEYDIAAVKGYIVAATSLDATRALIDQVQSGQPVADNAATVLVPAPDAAMLGNFYPGRIAASYLDNGSEPPNVAAAIAQLRDPSIAPVTATVTMGQGQLAYEINVPVASAARVTQGIQKVRSEIIRARIAAQAAASGAPAPGAPSPLPTVNVPAPVHAPGSGNSSGTP